MIVSVAQNVKHQLTGWLVNNALERYGRRQLWPKSWQCPGGLKVKGRWEGSSTLKLLSLLYPTPWK
jgi:hypothetical protein